MRDPWNACCTVIILIIGSTGAYKVHAADVSNVCCGEDTSSLMLLQVKSELVTTRSGDHGSKQNSRDLVFVHVPYNFGNTVEKVAMFPADADVNDYNSYIGELGGTFDTPVRQDTWEHINSVLKPGGEVWTHLHPDLQVTSEHTQCPLYMTPQKYWPKDVAERYFGNKTIFGILRDPYERLVAEFRGNMSSYGGSSELIDTCGLNAAVKKQLKDIVASGNIFEGACAHLPQAEYFEGPHGIDIAVDNWRFPDSVNEVFEEHGYDWRIRTDDIMHVELCQDVWSQGFDEETRSLVRQIYAKDFDLLCEKFGYCDTDQNTCLQGVPTMCPGQLFTWNSSIGMACPNAGVNLTNARIRPECALVDSTLAR